MNEYVVKLLYRAALDHWGREAQIRMVFEEMSELQKELCKRLRGKDNLEAIAEELADVRIMLEQMEQLFDCEHLCDVYRGQKLLRLAKELGAEALAPPEAETNADRAQALMAFVRWKYCELTGLAQDEVTVQFDAEGNFVISSRPSAQTESVTMELSCGAEEVPGDARN